MKNSSLMTLMGFILLILGILSLVLSITGLQFQFLLWMDYFGFGIGFLLRILMILGGFVIIYLSKFNWEDNDKEPEIE